MALTVTQSRSKTALVLTRRLNDELSRRYPSSKLRFAVRQVAKEEIDLIRERIDKGLDKNYKPMRRLSDGYKKYKQQIIDQGYRRGKGRGKKRRLVSIQPTAFAADSATDLMRLSGRMMRDMYVRDIEVDQDKNGNLLMAYTLDFKTARSKKIANYHINMGVGKARRKRDFWGPARNKKDTDKLTRTLLRSLQ
mgnify:CR=1 FL=1